MSNTQPLAEYWEDFRTRESDLSAMPPDSPLESPLSFRLRAHGDRTDSIHRGRAFSDAIMLETPRPALTPFHPASSLPNFLDSFGPLIFPLYRAALLRKRVLFMAEPPVHIPCSYGMLIRSSTRVAANSCPQYMICLYWPRCLILSFPCFLRMGSLLPDRVLYSTWAYTISLTFLPSWAIPRITTVTQPGSLAARTAS